MFIIGSLIVPALLGYMYYEVRKEEKEEQKKWLEESADDLVRLRDYLLKLPYNGGSWKLGSVSEENGEVCGVMERKQDDYLFRIERVGDSGLVFSCYWKENRLFEWERKTGCRDIRTYVSPSFREVYATIEPLSTYEGLFQIMFNDADRRIKRRVEDAKQERNLSIRSYLKKYRAHPLYVDKRKELDILQLMYVLSEKNTDLEERIANLPYHKEKCVIISSYRLCLYRTEDGAAVVFMDEKDQWIARFVYREKEKTITSEVALYAPVLEEKWCDVLALYEDVLKNGEKGSIAERKPTVQPEERPVSASIETLCSDMFRLCRQEEAWLTEEEKHLFLKTYPNDLQDMKAVFGDKAKPMPTEAAQLFEKAEKEIRTRMQETEEQVRHRKMRRMEEKVRVIQIR